MNTKHLLCSLLVLLVTATTFAQKSNAEKILGCWVLKKMEFSNPANDAPELSEEAMNSYVCFEKDGTFTTRLGGNESEVVKGKYQISADGKTLTQSRDIQDEGNDEQAEISVLDDTKLELKLEFGVMYFVRKN
ncbi:lipocalin family protein [Flavobacterium capsici]|uniref:Lipocalin-like domain-containing protein n=1 Tax=Flavobacterium capsici TaxID=3075618 RepID=A0AA96F0A3_9FLAO|nr:MULTISPECIES: lipocalin family protein [unclassified Flavobacterium]WNM18800.1 hypothetical protein RN608_12400 [Flavobacterium sp. PMR2A8]WNM22851.1 hypothetical protein RN605_05700 [Flavobacterium sp. PMTSA4]